MNELSKLIIIKKELLNCDTKESLLKVINVLIRLLEKREI